MSVSEGQKYKLLVLQARFLREKLKTHEQVSETAMQEFEKSYTKMVNRLPKEQKDIVNGEHREQKPAMPPQPPPPVKPKKAAPEKFKKLFKKIAKATHPDRLVHLSDIERAQKKTLFERASAALKSEDLPELVEVASLLHLTIEDPGQEEIGKIKSSISVVRRKIKDLEKTVAWSWYHMTNKERTPYMQQYIEHIYANQLKS